MAAGKNRLTMIGLKASTGKVVQDGGGLMLNRTEAGGTWVYRYSLAGRRRDMGLGKYPDISLAVARRERDKWQAVLVDGTDPISERKRRAEEELRSINAQGPTLEELVASVFESRRASMRGNGERGRWMSPLAIHVLPRLGKRRVVDLTQADIKDVLSPIWRKKPVTAQRIVQRLSIVFTSGKLSGLAVDPFTIQAASHLLGAVPREVQPIPATPWQDIPGLFRRLGENPTVSNLCLQLIILTAVRGDAARGAKFSEIDGDVWTVPKDRIKGREGKVSDFRVPLTPAALVVVEACRDTSVGGYLFPTRRRDTASYGSVSANAIEKALNVLGEVGRPHGFRTSFRTWVQDTQAASFEVAETTLGHTFGSVVVRSYARSDLLDQRRVLAEKWASYVTGPGVGVENGESTREEARP